MRKLSMDMKVDPKTTRNAVHLDLHLGVTHEDLETVIDSFNERAKNVLQYLNHNGQTVKIFSD